MLKNIAENSMRWANYSEHCIESEVHMAKHKTSNRSVLMYTKEGDLVGKFGSIRSAANHIGVGERRVWNVCNGVRKHVHGYVFKYADED